MWRHPNAAIFLLVLICIPYMATSAGALPSDPMNEQMLQIFELLKQGEKEIKLDPNHRDIVLLVGNSGAGKTTIGLLLTTDCTGLESFNSFGRYLIRDVKSNGTAGGKIGTKTIISKTIFPELMVHPENGVAFYDCPGFRDTRKRNASIEFANTLFYKKITDHARSIKVMMVVNYASVVSTGSREDFPNLLQSTLNLLKSTGKFNNSVGMVATKVGVRQDADSVVQDIKDFLGGIQYDLDDVLKFPDDVPRAINLLDALIEDGKNGKPKIHFTWSPTRAGILSKMPDMMAVRERIGDIIYNGLDYVSVTADDFGYPFSPEARELETFILREIDTSTRRQMSKLAHEFRIYWAKKMTDPSTTDVVEILRDLKDAKELLQPLIQSENNDTAIPKTEDLMRGALELFKELGIHNRSQSTNLQNFEDQDRFLDLLQKIHGSVQGLNQKQWIEPFQKALENIQVAIDWFQTLIELNRQLCLHVAGKSTESCESSVSSTRSSNVVTHVDGSNLRQLFSLLKQKFGKQIPHLPVKKSLQEYQSLTVKFLNEMIHRLAETRTRIIHSFVTDTAFAIKKQFLKEDHGLTVEGFKRSMESVAHALTKVLLQPSDGTVTPSRLLTEIQTALASAGSENILSLESVDIMTHQVNITEFLVSAGSPELGKLSRSDTLRPLERTTSFLTQAVDWLNFLDQLQGNLSTYKCPYVQQLSDDPVTEANYVARKSVLHALEEFSKIMDIQMPPRPRGSMDPTYFQPFVSRLNDILFRAWSQRKDYIMMLLDELGREMISTFRSKTGCSSENFFAVRHGATEFLKVIEDKELSLGSNSSVEQTSPMELAKLYEEILEPLRVELPSIGVSHLQQINDQQDVFQILLQVVPRVADVEMTRALSKLQPISTYLHHVESWYEFIYNLQSSFLGDVSIFNFTLKFGPTQLVQGVNETTWYNFLNQSAEFFHLPSPPATKNVLDEQGAVCFVNAVANAAYKSRSTLLKTNIHRLVNKLQENFYVKAQISQDAARFIQFMSTVGEKFSRFMHTTAYDDTIVVQSCVHDLDTHLGAVEGIGNEVLETLEIIKEQSSIFELLKEVSPQFSKMNSSELTDPFGQVIMFINGSITWFNYLEEMDNKLSTYKIHLVPATANNSSLRAPVFQVVGYPEKVFGALQRFSSVLKISQPHVNENVQDRDVFLRHVSRIFFRAWNQRTQEVTESTKALARIMHQHYSKLTSQADVKDLKEKTLRALNAFKKLASVDDTNPSLQSGRGFANLLSASLADLGIPMQTTMNQLLTHMESQDEVLGILGQVSSSWSKIDLLAGLRMLAPVTDYLDHASSWFAFLCELESQLARYALKSFRVMPESMAQQAPRGGIQNHEVAYQVIQELASVLRLQVPFNLEKILEMTDHKGLLRYADRLTIWVRQTRIDEVKQLVEEISVLLVRQIASRSANGSIETPDYKEFVQSTKNRLKHLCENANGSMSSSQLALYVERGLLDMFQTTEPFEGVLNSIEKQDEILQILATVKPTFAKIDSRAVLSPLQDVTFLADSLIWFEFLDKISVPLCRGHQPTTRPPMVWVTAENSLDALSSMSRMYSVPLPRRGVNTTRETIFLHEVNNLLYCAWDLNMEAVLALMNQLANNVTAYYENRADNPKDMDGFLFELENSRKVFGQFQDLRYTKDYRPVPSVLAQNISSSLKKIGLNLGEDILKRIGDYDGCFAEFNHVSEYLSTVNPEPCFAALEGVSKYLDRTISWYEFLSILEARLSRHEVQRDVESYTEASFAHQLHVNDSERQLIHADGATKFLNKIVKTLHISPPTEFQEILNSTGPNPALRHMNELIRRTLLTPMQSSESNNTLTIEGYYVLMSKATTCLPGSNLERVIINAHHTLFIDKDINALRVNNKSAFDIVIIANNVYSVSGHTIDLSGSNAKEHRNGPAGSPGLLGENGGSFFLISTSVTGSFSVITNGGKGSDGLPGSNGLAGRNGPTPTTRTWGNHTDPVCNPSVEPHYQVQSSFRYELHSKICGPSPQVCTGKVFKVYGRDGENGTSGGHGGKGGPGGKPGVTTIRILDNSTETAVQNRVMITSEKGQAGADGVGGKGGLGGLKGADLYVALVRKMRFNKTFFQRTPRPKFYASWTCTTDETHVSPDGSEALERASSGMDGNTGGNSRDVDSPLVPRITTEDVLNHVAAYVGTYNGSAGMDVFIKPAHHRFIQLLRGVRL